MTSADIGLRLQLPSSKTDQEGRGGRARHRPGQGADTCPVRVLETWIEASDCRFGQVFRKIDRWGTVEHRALGDDAVRTILRRRAAAAGIGFPLRR